MRIRAIASPSFEFEAHPDAAKQLIADGLYEEVPEEPQTAETPSAPAASTATVPTKPRRGRRGR